MNAGPNEIGAAVQRSEGQLRLVIDTIPGLVWSANPDGYIEYLNRRWTEYTGLTLEEASGWGWQAAVCPEDLPGLLDYWKSILASGKPGEAAARLRRFDGVYRWFSFRGVPLYDERGNLVKWYGQTTDIEDRKWAEAFLAGEKRILEMIATGDSLIPILDALCRLVEEMSSGSLATILLLDSDGKRLWHAAAPSLPVSYTGGMGGIAVGPSVGSCGTAVYRREPVIVADIATDPLWADYRELPLAHGLRASWSTPILSSEGCVLGTFAILSRKPSSPAPQHHHIIEQITHLASVAIERKRTEAALQESEERFRRMADAIPEVIWFTALEPEKVLYVSPSFERIWGHPVENLYRNPRLWTETIHPDDRERVTSTFSRWIAGEKVNYHDFEYRIVQPGGATRWIHERGVLSLNDKGKPCLASGISTDITEQKKAEEARRASELLARGQLNALTHTLDALATESEPDKFLEHVLRTIVEQSGAHSVSVWDRNDDGGWLDLIAVIEDGRFQTRNDAVHPAARLPILAQNHPVWSEVLRTGQHGVLEGIDQPTARMSVGTGPDAIWHRVLEDTDPDPAMALLKKHLRRLGVRAILFVPMTIAGRVAGIIGVRFTQKRAFRREEIELTRALAHQAMLAIQLMRLSRQSRQTAVMAERNRMARDIHDTLAQGFTGVIVQLEAAADATSKGLAKEAKEHLGRAGDLARESLKEARRSVRAIRPQALEERDLCEALDGLFQKMTAGTTVRAEFISQGEPRKLRPEWEENLLRIGQEVLTNALRHAQASHFRAQIAFAHEAVRLDLRDNGCGFNPAGKHDGFGLLGMRERVEGMGGQITIQSGNGEGTAILIALPLTDNSQPSES